MKLTNFDLYKYIIPIVCISFLSCRKFLDIKAPDNSLTSELVYNDNKTAAAVLTGLYEEMLNSNVSGGHRSITHITGLSADELVQYAGSTDALAIAYYRNSLTSQFNLIGPWNVFYNYIHTTNSALEGLNSSHALSSAVKKQLQGEAKFLRAFYYFYLVNLYGDVPLILTSDWKVNASEPRSPKTQIWQQIIQDLIDAQDLLSDKYMNSDAMTPYASGSEEKVRPTKWAATAFLARAYLYTGDWVRAEVESSKLINSSPFVLSTLNGVFLKNSSEAIWQLMPIKPLFETPDGSFFILTSLGPGFSRPVYLSSFLLNAFEVGDQRKINGNWINTITVSGVTYFYPLKYKKRTRAANTALTEYLMVLRLGEQYLIRSEARAQQGNLNGAIADLDKIRQRAGIPLIANTSPSISQVSLLDTINHERQVELFAEWGHRWLDLKRTGKVDGRMSVVTPVKSNGSNWQSHQQLYPLFIDEVRRYPHLSQTPGY